jgi:hypothetical protein
MHYAFVSFFETFTKEKNNEFVKLFLMKHEGILISHTKWIICDELYDEHG